MPGTNMQEVVKSSNRPDPKILDRLSIAQYACLALTGLISTIVLCGWLVPVIGSALPSGWSLMKANTALAMLVSTATLLLTRLKRSDRYLLSSLACASVVLILAGGALIEHWSEHTFGLDTLLAQDNGNHDARPNVCSDCFFSHALGAAVDI